MSDFDKEAERQRLREKYEEDDADREVTQQMSELLLRGATMTNKHCNQCQNPVFRYEGDEFCPVCQGAVEGEQAAAESEAAGQSANEAQSANNAETAANAGAAAAAGSEAETAGTPSVGGSETEQPAPQSQQSASRDRTTTRSEPAPDVGDLGEARASLSRTLTDLAERAEEAGDVGRQRDLLAAAREAAEAIEALDRAR